MLSKDQLKKVLSNGGVKLSSNEMATLVERFDVSSTKTVKISVEDLVAWLFPEKSILEGVERRLCAVFKQLQRDGYNIQNALKKFDKNGDGKISKTEFRTELAKLGVAINATEIRALFHRYDTSKSGSFEYKEFLKLFDSLSKDANQSKTDNESQRNVSSGSDTEDDEADDDDAEEDFGSEDSGRNTDDENALEEEDSKWLRSIKSALKDAFDWVQTDGMVNADELAMIARSMGQDIPSKDVSRFFEEVDQDGDGTVSFKEFSSWVLPKLKEQYNTMDREKEARILEVFQLLDHDNSNSLDYAEFTHFLESQQIELSSSDLASLLKYVDSDGSGTIDYAEFANLINSFSNASPKEQTRLFKPAVLLAVRKLCRGCVPDAEDHCRTFMHLPAAIRSSLLHSVSERPNRSLQSVVFRNLFGGTPRTNTSGGVQMSLTIKVANCVPVIEAEEDSFYDFEVIERSVLTTVCAHDGESSSPVYLGNVYRSDVAYDPKRPDRWVFDDSGTILVKAELPSSALENNGKRSERNSTSAGPELFLLVEFHVCVRQMIKDQKDTRQKKRGRRDNKGRKRSNKTSKNKKGGGGREDRKSHDHDSDDDSDFERGERKQNSDDDSDDGAGGGSRKKSGLKSMKERSLHMCCGWAKIPLESAKIKTLPSEHTIFCGNPWSGDGVEVSTIVAGRKKDSSKAMGLRKFFPGSGTAAKSVLEAKCKAIEDDLRFLPKAVITRLDSKDSLQLYHEYVRTSRKCVGAETPGSASKSPTNGALKLPKQGAAREAQVTLSDAMFPQGQHHAGVPLDPTIKVFPQILGDSSTFNAFKELVAKKGFMAGARKAMAARSSASSSTVAEAPPYHVAFQNCVLAFWPAVSATTVDDTNVKQQLLRDCVKAGLSTDEPHRSSHFSVGSPTMDPGTYTPFNIREVVIDEIHGGGS